MTPEDVDEALSIEIDVCQSPWGRGHFMDSISHRHPAKICRIDGKLVGYFIMMMAVDEAHLLTIGVAANFQGIGLGSRLLCYAMDLARDAKMKRFLLEVRPSNARALALYKRYGFRQIGVRRGYYPADGGRREDALVLTHALEEIFA